MERETRGGRCVALCTFSPFNLFVQFNSRSLANSPGNQRKTMSKMSVFLSATALDECKLGPKAKQ